MSSNNRNRHAVRVSIIYVVLALAWIFLSDDLLSAVADVSSMLWLSTAKGIFFVVVTGAGLYLTLLSVPGDSTGTLDSFVSGISPGRHSQWLNYSIAFATTVATLLLRNALVAGFGERPLMIVFMFPIILSALIGGAGPGLFATALSAALVSYFALQPIGEFHIASSYDLMQWGFLIANGVAVSMLSEASRRSNAKNEINRRLLDAVTSGTSDAIFVKDIRGRYLLGNEAAAGIVGRPLADMIGRSDRDLFPEGTAKALMDMDRRIMLAAKTETLEESLTTHDQKKLVFDVIKGPMFDREGTVIGLFGISRDITSRKQTEQQLQASEAALGEAQHLARIGNWTWEVGAPTPVWSRELYLIFGLDPAQPVPPRASGSQMYTAESWVVVSTAYDKATQDGEAYACDAEIVRPDGEHRWIVTRGEARRDADGQVCQLLGTVQDITERKRAELALKRSESTLVVAQQLARLGSWSCDMATGKVEWSAEMYRIFDWEPALGPAGLEESKPIYTPESWPRVSSIFKNAFDKGIPYEVDAEIIHANGSLHWVIARGEPVRDAEGRLVEMYGTVQDITERRLAEQQVRKLAQAVDQSPESISITGIDANIEYVNDAFVRASGYSREELMSRNSRMLQSGKTSKATYDALWSKLTSGMIWEGDFYNRRKDGSEYIEHAIISPIRQENGSITHYVAVKEDISEKLLAADRIHHLANYDLLTELPNRTLMLDRVGQLLISARRNRQYSALVLFNIDRFKTVNDAAGQDMGDFLLQSVAGRLTNGLREGDLVARIAGDEFAIVLGDLTTEQRAAANLTLHVAEKIQDSLRQPFNFGEESLSLTACLGIALFPDADDDLPLDVLRRANTALHHSKSEGPGQMAFFDGGLDEVAKQRFRVERELHSAIVANELRIFLQSQVDAAGHVVGAEALVRWQHPQRGLVPPGTFIPIAEESNLIIDIGTWVFTEVCRLLASESQLINRMRLSVNLSPRHFRQSGFVSQIKQILLLTGADPLRITLEVTEGMLIDNIEDVIAKMNELTAIGIHFSMDDFGTGYSSLSYLKRLPIHELKIDKTFVQDMTTDIDDASLVEAILSIGRHMHLQVVAEGVETAEQAAFLNERGQVIHQGYFFATPEPVGIWLEKRRHDESISFNS